MMRFSRRRGRGSRTWITIALLAVLAAAGVWSYTSATVNSPAAVRLVGESADGLIGTYAVSAGNVGAGAAITFPCGEVANRTTATVTLSLGSYTVTHDVYGTSVIDDVYHVDLVLADDEVAAGGTVDIDCDVYVAEPGTYTVEGTVNAQWPGGEAVVPFETSFNVVLTQ